MWDRNPVPLVKKERILEDDAANGVIRSGIVGYASVVLDSFVHDLASGSTVLNPERVPGERHRKDREGRKEATPSYEVLRRVQLEQQRLAWVEGAEPPSPTGLPEVYFGQPRLAAEEVEPVVVSDGDEGFHRAVRT